MQKINIVLITLIISGILFLIPWYFVFNNLSQKFEYLNLQYRTLEEKLEECISAKKLLNE